jgi:outer membrane protein with beta-barrel domain
MRGVVVCTLFSALLNCTSAQIKKPVHQQPAVPEKKPITEWIGIFAGPNFNSLRYHDNTTTVEGTNTGLHGGVFYKKDVNKNLSFQPSLLFSVRGGEINDVDSAINATLPYLELPINVLYVYKQLSIGGGPNFCYAVGGKFASNGVKRNAYDPSESFERTLKRFEFGANFMIAYEFKNHISVIANFSPGFTNIYKGDHSAPANLHANTSTFGLSLAYWFDISAEE